jgi:hypothetical protein
MPTASTVQAANDLRLNLARRSLVWSRNSNSSLRPCALLYDDGRRAATTVRRATTRYQSAMTVLLRVQGWLYVLTGLWPVLHLRSFEWATGEKYDDFLVHTVGLLLFVIGAVLLATLRRRQVTRELLWLAAGSAASLFAIDIVYFANGRLSPIYLVDAAIEACFAIGILLLARTKAQGTSDAHRSDPTAG